MGGVTVNVGGGVVAVAAVAGVGVLKGGVETCVGGVRGEESVGVCGGVCALGKDGSHVWSSGSWVFQVGVTISFTTTLGEAARL